MKRLDIKNISDMKILKRKTFLIFTFLLVMTCGNAQTISQFSEGVFYSSIGAEIVTEIPVSLRQHSSYIVSMSIISICRSSTLSKINSRANSQNVDAVAQNNVTTNAFYHIEGEPFYDYIITLPPYIVVTKPGVPDMIINAPTSQPIINSSDTPTGSLVASLGKTDFTVNGTLDVGKGEAKGAYVGTFALVVNCN